MKRSARRPEPDLVGRAGVSITLIGLAALFGLMIVGIVAAAAALAAFNINVDLSGLKNNPFASDVHPIPVPRAACPYLRLVSVAAANAAAPWSAEFQRAPDWEQFSTRISPSLASFDDALGGAVPHVPPPVAHDLLEVRRQVEIGRAALPTAHSVDDYFNSSGVITGYSTLSHASALVGGACGFPLAPPIPSA